MVYELTELRNYLDEIDNVILSALELRMSLIPHVAQYKIEHNMELFQPDREKKIYEKIDAFCNEKAIDANVVKGIYKEIIQYALAIEHEVAERNKK